MLKLKGLIREPTSPKKGIRALLGIPELVGILTAGVRWVALSKGLV